MDYTRFFLLQIASKTAPLAAQDDPSPQTPLQNFKKGVESLFQYVQWYYDSSMSGLARFYIAPNSFNRAIMLSTSSTFPPPCLGGGSVGVG